MKSRVFLITYSTANLSLVIYGLLALLMPSILLDPFSLHIYQFPDDASTAVNYLAALFRLLGFFNLILGVIGLLLLQRYWISRQAWILHLVMASSLLSYLGPIVFDNTVGSIGFFEIVEHILFVIMVLSGIIMLKGRNTADLPDSDREPGTLQRLGGTRFGVWVIKHIVSPLDRWLYRRTGGRWLSTGRPLGPILLLTTKGRRTGKERTTPVFYIQDGERVVICNVNPGFERPNPWTLNIRADPVVRLQIGYDVGTYRAHDATEEELKHYWPRLVQTWPAYQTHFERSGQRDVFILEPI